MYVDLINPTKEHVVAAVEALGIVDRRTLPYVLRKDRRAIGSRFDTLRLTSRVRVWFKEGVDTYHKNGRYADDLWIDRALFCRFEGRYAIIECKRSSVLEVGERYRIRISDITAVELVGG